MLSSQGVVLATAMAVSGTVILLALRLQKSNSQTTHQFSIDHHQSSQQLALRSCISSDHEKKREQKKKKRVHFAEDVVDPRGNGEDFRKQHAACRKTNYSSWKKSAGEMPANRVALYNGILRDRVIHQRVGYLLI
ncbi:hypothetical protein Ddye_021128 [Dipteronia dyeriana]|uniref:Uncharacterized protein n=1 Tax=Dipteronia dyeriana TaxID=168575 RepID=A0AAD9WX87_9ROSI|nr:hypothetical protein Ddye_021128 [Dipteronia dyeriana]